MNEIRQDDQCIERRGLVDDAYCYSVEEYQADVYDGQMRKLDVAGGRRSNPVAPMRSGKRVQRQ